MLWYPVPGKEVKATVPKSKSIGPDVMVVFGRPKGKRKSYLQWKEDNIPPQVVFEILSESNKKEDMQQKLEFYQEYGVEECYIYDPETYVLEGLMRRGNQLVPLEQVNGWVSPRLGIKFETAGGELGIYHPNGKRFLTPLELNAESEQRIQAEQQRADLERQRAERFAEYIRSLGLDPDHLPEGN